MFLLLINYFLLIEKTTKITMIIAKHCHYKR